MVSRQPNRRGAKMPSVHSTPVLYPLGTGQVFHFVFSNKTKHDDICLAVRAALVERGLNIWQHATNIPRDSDNWFKEWFPREDVVSDVEC